MPTMAPFGGQKFYSSEHMEILIQQWLKGVEEGNASVTLLLPLWFNSLMYKIRMKLRMGLRILQKRFEDEIKNN